MKIKTVEDLISGDLSAPVVEVAFLIWSQGRRNLPQRVNSRVKAIARVDHGRWLADCPFCTGAEMVSKQDHRFFCHSCLNAEVNGDWIGVQFPSNVAAIEEVLLERANSTNRHWYPHESVEDLRKENALMRERGR